VSIPLWKPVTNTVAAITNSNPGVVTTASPHGYSSGLIVRFEFFANFGMIELIGNTYFILVLSPTTFTISQDTTLFTPFSNSPTLQSPQVVPVGEVANTLKNAEKNISNNF
jgi:hypothetical protein